MVNFTQLDAVRQTRPLIHCISNLVSANDCANLALAVGASPIMAQAVEEMADITAASDATVLNTGTPDMQKFDACLLCGKAAEAAGQPLVLDPVGVGASPWRLRNIQAQLHLYTPTILRVNLGEAQALASLKSREQGVDSPAPASPEERRQVAVALARRRRTVVLLSGPEDLVTDGETVWRVWGGSAQMPQITGAGCMLSVLCGVFAAVEPDALSAALLASSFWKVCSQTAQQLSANRGPGSFHAALLDAAGYLTAADFSKQAQMELL